MGAHDFFCAHARLGCADRREERTVDEHRMTMTCAGNRTHDGRTCPAIPIDDGANRRDCDERHVNERHERRRKAWPIDHSQACKQRRKLSLLELGVLDKSRGQTGRPECVDNHARIGPDDDDDVIDFRVEKRTHERVRKVSPPSSGSIALGRPMRVDLPAASTMAGITARS